MIRRYRQVGRRRPLTDAAGGVVLGTVAGAEPTVIIALMGERNAAQVGAGAAHDQPLFMPLLDPVGVGLGIRKAGKRHALRLFNFLLRTMADEERIATPEHLDDLPF